MPLVYINTITAFTVSLLGLLLYQSQLISSLLCLEDMILSIFLIASVMILSTHIILASIMPIVLLVFAACNAALGLSLFVIVSNTYDVVITKVSSQGSFWRWYTQLNEHMQSRHGGPYTHQQANHFIAHLGLYIRI